MTTMKRNYVYLGRASVKGFYMKIVERRNIYIIKIFPMLENNIAQDMVYYHLQGTIHTIRNMRQQTGSADVQNQGKKSAI